MTMSKMFDSEVTYNLGVGYDFTDSTKLVLNHSTGFKAPTFNDLYYPFGGNPELKPETSETTEVLLKQSFELGQFGISLYQTEVENLIAWAPQDNGIWAPQNINAADIQGAEFELNLAHGNFRHDFQPCNILTRKIKTTGAQLVSSCKRSL